MPKALFLTLICSDRFVHKNPSTLRSLTSFRLSHSNRFAKHHTFLLSEELSPTCGHPFLGFLQKPSNGAPAFGNLPGALRTSALLRLSPSFGGPTDPPTASLRSTKDHTFLPSEELSPTFGYPFLGSFRTVERGACRQGTFFTKPSSTSHSKKKTMLF